MSLAAHAALTVVPRVEIPTPRPLRMLCALMAADSISLAVSVALSVFCKALITGHLGIAGYVRLGIFLPAFLAAYAAVDLYSGLMLPAPEELRRCTACSTVMFVLLSALTISFRGARTYAKPTLFFAIALTVVLVPLARSIIRRYFRQRNWWGFPAVVFGSTGFVENIIDVMARNVGLGLKPIAIVWDHSHARPNTLGIPILSTADAIGSLNVREGTYAILPWSSWNKERTTFQAEGWRFSHILIIPDELSGIANLFVCPKMVGNVLALEVCRQVLLPRKRLAKRMLDFLLALLITPLVLPLLGLLAACVRMDSKGPVFFAQKRIGRGGLEFTAWKFRTMIVSASDVFGELLARDPCLRDEWERNHKLKNDPRVTRMGGFLRRTSLDELPQLWNVLKGEMSLVGPRPIVQAEIAHYGSRFESYKRVPAGITGLWQVSGRNDTTYEERVSLDDYYVRNWSVWLDFHILSRTIAIVLRGKGAY